MIQLGFLVIRFSSSRVESLSFKTETERLYHCVTVTLMHLHGGNREFHDSNHGPWVSLQSWPMGHSEPGSIWHFCNSAHQRVGAISPNRIACLGIGGFIQGFLASILQRPLNSIEAMTAQTQEELLAAHLEEQKIDVISSFALSFSSYRSSPIVLD